MSDTRTYLDERAIDAYAAAALDLTDACDVHAVAVEVNGLLDAGIACPASAWDYFLEYLTADQRRAFEGRREQCTVRIPGR